MTELVDRTRIDDATLTQIVSADLGASATIVCRDPDEELLGAGTGTKLVRLRGLAQEGTDGPTPWSVVIKYFTPEHHDFQTRSDDPGAADYWKREWCCYRSSWQQHLPGPLTAPRSGGRCPASTCWHVMRGSSTAGR